VPAEGHLPHERSEALSIFGRSFLRLQARGTQPIADMRGRLGLPGPSKKQLPRRAARRFSFGSFLKSFGLCRQPLFKSQRVFDTRALSAHGPPVSTNAPFGALLWMVDKLKSEQGERARELWAAKGKQAFETDPATHKETDRTDPAVRR
jgi:hypothetical protein